MDAKTAFLDQIVADLPAGIKDHLETPIPAFVATTSPTDVDSAIIVQGILAHNLNEVGRAFEGLTLAAIPMYIAQLNTVNQGMLLSALEFIGGSGDFRIISPTAGGSYPGFFGVREGEWYAVEIIRGDVAGVSCQIAENDAFDLTESEETPGVWLAEWPTAIGYHNATFTVTFADDSTATKSASFTVQAYPVTPADGAEIPLDTDFPIRIDTQGDEVVSASIEIRDADTGEIVYTSTMAAIDEFLMECIASIPKIGEAAAAFISVISLQMASMSGMIQQTTSYRALGTT